MPDSLICKLVRKPGYVVPGSTEERCSQCGEKVWVAPSSQLILDDNPEIKILCQDCSLDRVIEKPGDIQQLIPAQLREIEQYHRRQ